MKKKYITDIDLNGNGIYDRGSEVALLYKRLCEVESDSNELIISNEDYPFSINDYINASLVLGSVEHPITQISFESGKIYLKFDKLTESGLLKVVCSNVGIVNASIKQLVTELCFTALEDNSSVGVAQNLKSPVVMYKSSDRVTWETWDYSTINLNNGDKVYLKGEGTALSTSDTNYFQFSMSGKISASGDCTSLTNGVISDYCYSYMFNGCTSLVTAPELPATTLAEFCYYSMFSGCTSLVNAPKLPANKLASGSYAGMFINCSSLVNAPKLPATNLAESCYAYMFFYCSSLVNAPELPATNLANSCYVYMFDGCTSLVNAPKLPATTLAEVCYYYMFGGCTSLVNAPELPATNLVDSCYNGMFQECTSLVNAPKLPATTLASNCYANMFYDCTKLSSVTMLGSISNSDYSSYANSMLTDVASSGTFTKNPSANLTAGGGLIPSGWTVVDYAG